MDTSPAGAELAKGVRCAFFFGAATCFVGAAAVPVRDHRPVPRLGLFRRHEAAQETRVVEAACGDSAAQVVADPHLITGRSTLTATPPASKLINAP